jgi:hypothetical protein
VKQPIMSKEKFLTLQSLGLNNLDDAFLIPSSQEATDILTMVAMHESGWLRYNRQINGGPALGFYQMEEATYMDIFENYLRYRSRLYNFVIEQARGFSLTTLRDGFKIPHPEILTCEVSFAAIMARIHFRRVPEGFPEHDSEDYLERLGEYCKKYYNGPGKAESADYTQALMDMDKYL